MTVEQLRSFSQERRAHKKAAHLERLRLNCLRWTRLEAGGNVGVLPRSRRTAKMQGQAAGLNSLVALALMGSSVSVATRWVNWVSAFVLAVKVSNCLRAWEVHSSIASEGDFTANRAWAKSSDAVVLAFIISISLAENSLAPLLAIVNTASMVPLLLSATSLNLA